MHSEEDLNMSLRKINLQQIKRALVQNYLEILVKLPPVERMLRREADNFESCFVKF